MGKKGGSRGLKRKPAPKFWPIHRKEFVWVVRPSPGPHPLENCLPIAVILRDMLGLAKTRKEVKRIVSQGKVRVDGKVRLKDNFPVGLMDVISIPDANKFFRVLPSNKGPTIYPIDEDEADFKLCRVEGKTTVKGGHVQLNLHDGSNVLVRVADPRNPKEDVYNTFDTLKVSLPERRILEHVKMEVNSLAMITGGKNVGRYGRVSSIEEVKGEKRRKALVTIVNGSGGSYQTVLDYVFVIGVKQPLISVPEVA